MAEISGEEAVLELKTETLESARARRPAMGEATAEATRAEAMANAVFMVNKGCLMFWEGIFCSEYFKTWRRVQEV